MTDLITLMSKLVTPAGDILIPGVEDLVAPLTNTERSAFSSFSTLYASLLMHCRARYETLDYAVSDVEHSAGAQVALSSDKVTVLMGRMRYPSLSLHGIEGAFSAAGAKTVIPAKVSGKFSIRSVHLLTLTFDAF